MIQRQFTENVLSLPRQIRQRMFREHTENQSSKISLVNQALFPEGLITLNK